MARQLPFSAGIVNESDAEIDVAPERGLSATEILLEGDDAPTVIDGATIAPDGMGGMVVDFGAIAAMPVAEAMPWDGNLAETIDEGALDRIASELVEAVDADIASRKEWENSYLKGVELMGLKIEDRSETFVGACGAQEPLLAEAVIRFWATARGELLPAGGPVKTTIQGSETPEIVAQAERVKLFMNYNLTVIDRPYYRDTSQMLFWLPIAGSAFKKIYQDPNTGLPISRFITPDKFIIAYTTTSLETCPRMTHEFQATKRDVIWGQLNGVYRQVELQEPNEAGEQNPTTAKIDRVQGTTPTIALGDDRFTLYECHADYDLPGYEHRAETGRESGLKLPYIFTIDKASRKVLSIRRNWREGDPAYKRRQYFVPYQFLPGFGIYSFGLSHLLGGYADAATKLLRQLVDAGVFQNFPGGVRQTGAKFTDPNIKVGPGEFPEIDTGGLPLATAFMSLPYKGPSVVLKDLRTEITESARRLGATTDIAVGDGRQDAPVGTTVALLEAATKIESAIIKGCYVSQAEEFALLSDLFGETLPDGGYPFLVPGGESAIMREDFSSRIDVIPVGDPNIPSSAQRMLRSEAMLRSAGSAPDIHNMREVYSLLYETWGYPRAIIDRILPPPQQAQPADPVTENQNALRGGQLAVGPWQDDDAHIAVHMAMAETAPVLQAHIAEHFASKFRKAVEQTLGIPLPPAGQQIPPEIENHIARLTAQAIDAIKQATGTMPGGGDMLAVAMEDIKVKARDVELKNEAAMAKISQAAFDSYLKHLEAKGSLDVKLQIARMQVEAKRRAELAKPAQQRR